MKPLVASLFLILLAAPASAEPAAPASSPRFITIGVIAKSQSNPVFQAARVGAEDAARDLGAKYNLSIKIDWRTPNEEDAQRQSEAIEQLVLSGADGIAISCSDANISTSAINSAVDDGVPVATFDSDAPASKRFVTYGIDDEQCGRQVMDELARQMGGKGIIAILAGNQNAPNLQHRAQGVIAEAQKFPGITIRGVFYHRETPQDAAAKVEEVMEANPDINGWAMIGGWALFTDNAIQWKAGTVKCASVDALPAQLSYVRNGKVPVLLGQQCYQWGYQSVSLLIDKIVFKKDPPAVKQVSALVPVTIDNVDAYAKNWALWLHK
jgi:ribose transport system substrate-binding protein